MSVKAYHHYPGHEQAFRSGYAVLRLLREGKAIEFEGLIFEADDTPLEPGDMYFGCRNTVDLYTCREVDVRNGWVLTQERTGYPFDINECQKVREAPEREAEAVHPLEVVPFKGQ